MTPPTTIICVDCSAEFSIAIPNCPACNWAQPWQNVRDIVPFVNPEKTTEFVTPAATSSSTAPLTIAQVIAEYRQRTGTQAKSNVIAVYGVENAGKSFLNKRISNLFAGNSTTEQTGVNLGSTRRDTGTTHEFRIRAGQRDNTIVPLLVVDVAGEDVIDAATDAGATDSFSALFKAMDALVLYIPAPILVGADWTKEKYGTPPRSPNEIYQKILSLILDDLVKENGGTAGRCAVPIFVALSKAWQLEDWEGIRAGKKESSSALSLVEQYSPGLASYLVDNFNWVSYGFVASHENVSGVDAMQNLASYGVTNMLYSLEKLIRFSAHKKNTDLIPAYCATLSDNRTGPRAGISAAINRWIVRLNLIPSRLVSLNISSVIRYALSIALGTAVLVIGALVAFSTANNNARTQREQINQSFGAVKDLPEGFAVRSADAWSMDSRERNRMLNEAQRAQLSFGISADRLVSAPRPELAARVTEQGISFEAFSPTPSTANGREVMRIYDALRKCPAGERLCQDASPPEPPRAGDSKDRTKRALSYVYALYSYNYEPRNATTQSKLQKTIGQFHRERSDSLGKSYPNKQVRLPEIATGLMQAHHEYATNSAKRQALADYGQALDRILSSGMGDVKNVSIDELEMIGVSQPILAMHLIATVIAENDQPENFHALLDKRMKLAGYASFQSALATSPYFVKVMGDYAELGCLINLLVKPSEANARRVHALCEKAATGWKKDDSIIGKQIWERAALTMPETWSNLAKPDYQELAFDRYLRQINKAAASISRDGLSESAIRQLKTLEALKEPNTLSVLTDWRGGPFITIVIAALLASLLGFFLHRLLSLHQGRVLAITPLTADRVA